MFSGKFSRDVTHRLQAMKSLKVQIYIKIDIKIFQSKATYRNELLFKKIMKGEQPDINSYDSDEELNISQLEKKSLIDAIYPVR